MANPNPTGKLTSVNVFIAFTRAERRAIAKHSGQRKLPDAAALESWVKMVVNATLEDLTHEAENGKNLEHFRV
jgi:hypothetical protein